jgi:hypothetical protein
MNNNYLLARVLFFAIALGIGALADHLWHASTREAPSAIQRMSDFQHVHIFKEGADHWFLYSLKSDGPVTATDVADMDASNENVGGISCIRIRTRDAEGKTASLHWTQVHDIAKVATTHNVSALVCNQMLLEPVAPQ